VFTDNPLSALGNYRLEVTAKVGLTSTLYSETITISEPLCGTAIAPAPALTLDWKSTPLPTDIYYSVGSNENKEIVLDPETYI
jgi:hypothetical protein